MKIPRQNEPVSVNSMREAPRLGRGPLIVFTAPVKVALMAMAFVFGATCSAAPGEPADPVTALSSFFSGHFRSQLAGEIAGNGRNGAVQTFDPALLYRQLLKLRARRVNYSNALAGYLESVQAQANIVRQEQDYVVVEDAAWQLESSIRDLVHLVDDMSVQLDARDQKLRDEMTSYMNAKTLQIHGIVDTTRFFGMKEPELVAAVKKDKELAAILDNSIASLLAEIKKDNPNVSFALRPSDR